MMEDIKIYFTVLSALELSVIINLKFEIFMYLIQLNLQITVFQRGQ